jgi:hypothetical protein
MHECVLELLSHQPLKDTPTSKATREWLSIQEKRA